MTHKELLEKLGLLEGQVIDLKVDCNIKDERIRELEQQLREARFAVRELEVGTQTMRTLALAKEEPSFDPRETGEFRVDCWRTVR